jgi:hypothetical protein
MCGFCPARVSRMYARPAWFIMTAPSVDPKELKPAKVSSQ